VVQQAGGFFRARPATYKKRPATPRGGPGPGPAVAGLQEAKGESALISGRSRGLDLAGLDPNLEFLGFIRFDEAISQAVNRQRPVLSLDPRAQASKSFKWIARQLLASPRRRGRGAASSPFGLVGMAINNRKDTGNDYHG